MQDSPIADFIDSFPAAPAGGSGQINAYEIFTAGFDGTLHFDLTGHYLKKNGASYINAPFSHDAEGTPPSQVPEPHALGLLALALLGSAYRQRQKSARG